MKRSEAVKEYEAILRGGICGSFEHIERLFSKAFGRGDLWDPEEPKLPKRLGVWGGRLTVPDESGWRYATLGEYKEAAARYNTMEEFSEWLEEEMERGGRARGLSAAGTRQQMLAQEREKLK